MRRHRSKTLIWCDENGNPAPDESAGYIRALTKAELEEAAIAELNETLGSNRRMIRAHNRRMQARAKHRDDK